MPKGRSRNLLDLKPVRRVEWEVSDDRVILIAPKFRNRTIQNLFEKLSSAPNFRIKLDDYGSFVWRMCDGSFTVMEIIEAMERKFEGSAEYLPERTIEFIRNLASGGFIELIE